VKRLTKRVEDLEAKLGIVPDDDGSEGSRAKKE
jgi:hypothetical protein